MAIVNVESKSQAVEAFKTGNLYTKEMKYPVQKFDPALVGMYVVLTQPEKSWYDELNASHHVVITLPSSGGTKG